MKIEVIEGKIPKIRMPIEEWKILGTLLYGKDFMDWKFICPRCKNIQTGKDFLKYKNNDEVDSILTANYHCLSRYSRITDIKCYWTLDGIYKIHKLELKAKRDDGTYEISPSFEFADALVTEEEILMIKAFGSSEMKAFGSSGMKDILNSIIESGKSESGNKNAKIWAAFLKEGFNL